MRNASIRLWQKSSNNKVLRSLLDLNIAMMRVKRRKRLKIVKEAEIKTSKTSEISTGKKIKQEFCGNTKTSNSDIYQYANRPKHQAPYLK